jgi:hypothetical protein
MLPPDFGERKLTESHTLIAVDRGTLQVVTALKQGKYDIDTIDLTDAP